MDGKMQLTIYLNVKGVIYSVGELICYIEIVHVYILI